MACLPSGLTVLACGPFSPISSVKATRVPGFRREKPLLRTLLLWKYTSRPRSEEHTSELQSLMRISYAVFCLKKKKAINRHSIRNNNIIHTRKNRQTETKNTTH